MAITLPVLFASVILAYNATLNDTTSTTLKSTSRSAKLSSTSPRTLILNENEDEQRSQYKFQKKEKDKDREIVDLSANSLPTTTYRYWNNLEKNDVTVRCSSYLQPLSSLSSQYKINKVNENKKKRVIKFNGNIEMGINNSSQHTHHHHYHHRGQYKEKKMENNKKDNLEKHASIARSTTTLPPTCAVL